MNGQTSTGNREIRIFLSSTFSDMHEERNYLTKKIFPRIREICERREVRFTVLDLRWGITEEESRTGKVIEICMDEIKRTKPFFIGLLGGRYGWIPTEKETELNRHLPEKYPWITDYLKSGCSITEIEMQYAVLNEQENIDAFFFLRDMESVPSKFREKDGSEGKNKLERLRSEVIDKSREGRCTADFYSDMPTLGRFVQKRLLAMIDKRFPENEERDSGNLIIKRQEFERSKLRMCYADHEGRRKLSMDSAFSHNPDIIFVEGAKGMGKSALLANWHPEDKLTEGLTEWTIIRTDVDNDINSPKKLAGIFMDQLRRKDAGLAGLETGEATELQDFVSKSSLNIVWIIDGPEKIRPDIGFLFSLPENVRTVIAAEKEFLDKISGHAADMKRQTVKIAPLKEDEKLEILESHLSEYGKSLTEKQEIHIMSSTILSAPSLLKLFTGELIQFGIHEQLDGFIDRLVSAGSREEFISRVLDIIEGDFEADTVRKILGLIACSEYGLDERTLTDELGLSPLDWSAIYSAIETLVLRHDGRISIRENYVLDCISARYQTELTSIRRAAVRILEKERNALLHRLGTKDRFYYRALGIALDDNVSGKLGIVSYSLSCLYSALGETRQARKTVTGNLVTMTSELPVFKVSGLVGKTMQFRPERFFSFQRMLSYLLFDTEDWIFISHVNFYRQTCPELPERIMKKLKRMPLPKGYRTRIYGILKDMSPQPPAGNYEDSWEPGKEISDIMTIGSFLNRMMFILSDSRIRHIKEKAEAMAASLPDDSVTCTFMKYIISYALVREGKPDNAEKILFSTSGNTDPENAKGLKFEIAFARNDFDECRNLLKDIRHMTSSAPDERNRRLRLITELSWELAIEENTSCDTGEERDAGVKKRLQEFSDACFSAGENGTGYLRSIAYFLQVKKCFRAATEAYLVLLDSWADNDSPSFEYENFGHCLNASGQYEEAAQAYGTAAGYCLGGKDIIGYMENIYHVAENLVLADKGQDAAATVQAAFNNVLNAAPDLPEDVMANCMNRIIVLLSMTCGFFDKPEEPLETGCTSMKKILESPGNHSIRHIANYAYLLDRVSALYPDRESFAEAFSVLSPHLDSLIQENKEKFAGILAASAIVAGDNDTASRILDKAGAWNGHEAGYAEQKAMLGMSSADAGIRKAAVSNLIRTVRPDSAAPEDIRKHLVRLLRKYGCLESFMEQCRESADADSLFALWNISAATQDKENLDWCESSLKGLVKESRSADILARYIGQRRKFALETGPETIAALYKEWLGDSSVSVGNVIAFIRTVLKNTTSSSANGGFMPDRCNSRKKAIMEYVDSAIRNADDKQVFADSIIRTASNMPLEKEADADSIIAISDIMCRLYAAGNFPSLKRKLPEILSGTAEFVRRNFKDRKLTMLADIYDLYRLLDEPAPYYITKAKLKCCAGIPPFADSPFADVFTHELSLGYTPDAEDYALATGFCISRNMTEEAEEILGLYEEKAGDDAGLSASAKLCRAILDTKKCDYAAAAAGFSSVLTEDFMNSKGYNTFCSHFSCFHDMADMDFNLQMAAISAIYAGNYPAAIAFAGRINGNDERYMYTGDMLVCLSLLHGRLYDDALKFYQDKFRTSIDNDFFPPLRCEGLTSALINIEAAKMHAEKGDFAKASEIIRIAGTREENAIPSIYRTELEHAKALLQELKESGSTCHGKA